MYSRRAVVVLAVVTAALAVPVIQARQAADGTAELPRKVQALETAFRSLQSRVDALERAANSTGGVPASTGSPTKAAWRTLREGMSESDVRRILGEPDTLDGGSIARWGYRDGGSVSFASGKVIIWHEPR